MKLIRKFLFILFLPISIVLSSQTICPTGTIAVLHNADNSANRFANNPGTITPNLLSYITVSDIAGGTYVNSNGQTFCGITMGSATLFSKTTFGTAYDPNVYYNYSITTASTAPILNINSFRASIAAYDGILNVPATAIDRLSYSLRVAITDVSTGVETVLINSLLINNYNVASAANYNLQPGKTYQVRYYAWRPNNNCTSLYMDNPRLFMSPVPNASSASLCSTSLSGTVGSALSPFVNSSTPTGTELRWLQGATDVTANTVAAGAYTPHYFNTSSSCYYPAGNTVTVSNTAGPAFTTDLTPGSESVCQNATVSTLTVAANNVTYQWYSNTSNSTVGGTPISGAANASYTPSSSTVGTLYYYVVITSNTGSGCTTTSNIRSVTVNANPTFTTNQSPGTQTVCQNTKPGILLVGGSNVTYQWYTNTVNSNTGGTPISGATLAMYDPPASSVVGTTYYYAVITSTATGCTAASVVRAITVTPATTITTQPDSTPQNLCLNGTGTTLTVAATGSGTLTYQWWYSTAATGGTTTSVGATGTSASYTIPTTAAFATRYYYVVVTSSTCGSATSSPRTPVTVNANPTFTTNQTTGTQTVCQNNPATALAVAANNVTFQWYSNVSNSNIGGTAISGANAATYNPSTATPGTTYYYAVITDTTTGCSSASNVRGVTVTQLITSQPDSTPQNICVGGTATTLTVGVTGSATSGQWYYSDAPSGGTITTAPGGTNTPNYTPATTTAFATRYYFVRVTGACGSVDSSPRTPVTVYAYPTAVSVTPATQTVAFNGTPANLTATTTGATSYQWYSNTTNSNTGGTAISGATASTYTPPTNVAGTQYYYIVASGGGTCTTSSSAVQVTVSPCPAGNTAPPVNTFITTQCPAGTANLNTQSHTGTIPANTTLVWFRDAAHTIAVLTPTAVGAGTYYAFYYSSADNCYSPASASVNVLAVVCSSCVAADPQTVDLSISFTVAPAPSGSVIQWHNSATPSSGTLLGSTSVQATSTPTNYWVYYYDAVNTCYSPGSQVTIVTNSCCNYPTVDLYSVNNSAPPSGSSLVWYTTRTHTSGTEVAGPYSVGNGTYWPYFYNSGTNSYSSAGAPVLVVIDNVCTQPVCYKPAATVGTALDTKVGISALGRAGAPDADNWPMTRKGGWIALESKTKAFVPNRVAFNASGNPIGIAVADFVEGMMVYDSTNNCMKIYTLKQGDSAPAWHCVATQTCPD